MIPRREPPARPPLAVPLGPTAPRPPGGPFRPGPRRADDRRIAAASILVAGAFLAAAAIAALAGALGAAVLSPWLPLHLALAGGASTAIAGVMPFFVAALSAGRPAPARVRGGAVALVAIGASLVAVRGIVPAAVVLPPVGGVLYLGGITLTGIAVRAGGSAGLMVRRPIVTAGYSLALVNVAIGGLLGTLAVAGWPPVLEHWDRLKPAHAWTNVIGFVSLVIVATLLHFLPTVLGTRILPRRTAAAAVLGIIIGSPVVVAGLALGEGALAALGALLVLGGACSMVLEAGLVIRTRGRWTSDPAWHRMASLSLVAGVGWFAVGVAIASWLVVSSGPTAGAWDSRLVAAPLVLGWVAQVLVGSWTHLLPSIGPGGPPEHARQRIVLGRAAWPRLLALNLGVALLAVGWPASVPGLALAGGLFAGAAIVSGVGLAVVAVRVRAG